MKKDLWLRLKRYHFNDLVPAHLMDRVAEAFGGADASTRAFASKVARKHGWTTHFALRAIEEYRKFVFLGMISDVSVTPSKTIDQVWHEHLLFTRAYRDFCRDVLGREFDHHPELMPTDDQTDVFAAQFDATLARYHTEFHVIPPQDIWGTPKFKADTRSKRQDRDTRDAGGTAALDSDAPLYSYFTSSGDASFMPEFGGGGGFSGGGAGDGWGGHDATSSDGGSSGDGGGSGCSSSCGGGGCGGD